MKTEAKVAAVKSVGQTSNKTAKSDTSKSAKSTGMIRNCRYCGKSHAVRSRPAFGQKCRFCGNLNHFSNVCRKKASQADEVTVDKAENENAERFFIQPSTSVDVVESEFQNISVAGFSLENDCNVVDCVENEWLLDFAVSNTGCTLKAKVDTGAQASVMSYSELQRVSPQSTIIPSTVRVTAYSGHSLPILGVAKACFEASRKYIYCPISCARQGVESKNANRVSID